MTQFFSFGGDRRKASKRYQSSHPADGYGYQPGAASTITLHRPLPPAIAPPAQQPWTSPPQRPVHMVSQSTLHVPGPPSPYHPVYGPAVSDQTPANTRKRKRKNSSQHGDDGIDDDVPVQRDQIADSTEYSAIVTPEERSQRRLAGQVLTNHQSSHCRGHSAPRYENLLAQSQYRCMSFLPSMVMYSSSTEQRET